MLKRNVFMLLVIICNPRISPLLFILSVLTLLKHSSRLPARKHFLRQTVSNLTSAQRFLKMHFSSLKYYYFFKNQNSRLPARKHFLRQTVSNLTSALQRCNILCKYFFLSEIPVFFYQNEVVE